MEYSRERSDDLMRAYDEYIASCGHIRMPDVYERIVKMPSRRFWVSDIRATLVVSAMMRNDARKERMWPLRRKMYEEIYRRVTALRRERPWLTVSESCAIVVSGPAPEFYLTPGSAKMMVCRARKEWMRRKRERLRLP